MSCYKKCTTCGEEYWSSDLYPRHKCEPVWQILYEDVQTIRAYDAENAAKKFAELYDQDEHILMDVEMDVKVRKDEEEEWVVYTCSAEAELIYYASKKVIL